MILKSILLAFGLSIILSDFVLVEQKSTDASDFSLDELGNLYLIHDTYIERINANGGHTFRTSELNSGNIEYFDVTNPLKPFIHYRSQGKIVVFDNTLSEQGRVDLFEKGLGQIEMVCGSRGDAYWMWDSRNSEMIRVDQNFNKLASTGNISTLTGMQIEPTQIIERGSQLYLRDPSNGVVIFDVYGSYRTTLKILTTSDIQVFSDEIIYHEGAVLNVVGKDLISVMTMSLPIEKSSRVQYFNQRLYTLADGVLSTWKPKENVRN